jgi:hypothetical protein
MTWGCFVVLLEPIADGVTATLKSGPSGAAQILWKESGTGVKWAVVRVGNPVPFEIVRFSGVCMIDSANPAAKNPGVSSAYSEGSTAEGQPGKPTDQQWLLMKFAGGPFTLPWQDWNWHVPVVVSAAGGDEGWFVYWAQLILNDFHVADDPPLECATWATSPIDTIWTLGGNGVSAKIPTSLARFPDGQSLNIKWVNSCLNHEVAHGVALRPHSWWGWGDPPPDLSATIQVDYTKCRIVA